MRVFYVICTGNYGMKEKEFHNLNEATVYYNECKQEKEWKHVELTKQLRAYLPETDEEFE